MPILHAIAAMSENRVIGNRGKIPWHLPEDFRWFKQQTMGGTLIMGRKTYESIGMPLPGRTTLVLSRSSPNFPGVEISPSLDELLHRDLPGPVYIAGGAEIYREALPYCADLFLTHIKGVYEGDTFFPPFEQLFPKREIVRETVDFIIERHFK